MLNNFVVIAVFFGIGAKLAGEPSLTDAQRLSWLVPALGIGTTLGIAVMALALVPALIRARSASTSGPTGATRPCARCCALSAWTFGYVVANQVALLVIYNLARPGDGGLSAYQLAFVFFQLPHGLLAVSITTTFTPDLARAWHRGDRRAFDDRISLGLRMLGLLVIPASIGYFVLARPLVVAALQRGAFDAADASATANALAAFALGLFGFSAYLFVLRGFYAQQDTRTPFWINLVENALNIVLAVALVGAFGVPGLAVRRSPSPTRSPRSWPSSCSTARSAASTWPAWASQPRSASRVAGVGDGRGRVARRRHGRGHGRRSARPPCAPAVGVVVGVVSYLAFARRCCAPPSSGRSGRCCAGARPRLRRRRTWSTASRP